VTRAQVVRARAPGRVNLIGDHTDYAGGLVCPVAIDLETRVTGVPGGTEVRLVSDAERGEAVIPLSVTEIADPRAVSPPWARYVAGVVRVVAPERGFVGKVTSSLPIGAGLASSAALEVAVALALGHGEGAPVADPADPGELALACQRAEQEAVGVPCGVMDQLAAVAGVEGHALLIDCSRLSVTPIPLPPPTEAEILVVHSGERRVLGGTAYAERRAQVEAAARAVGAPLQRVGLADLEAIDDSILRRRARHVTTENERVRAFATALRANDPVGAGRLMRESHESLRDDFEVSTAALEELVSALSSTEGVYGARLTGAGFGGCVVALTRPGVSGRLTGEGWRRWRRWVVHAAAGASVETLD